MNISTICVQSIEVFVFLVYGAESLCDWCPTFRHHRGLIFKGRFSSEGDQFAFSKRRASITHVQEERRRTVAKA